jgi:SOS-response transcriptional repressor LexA
MSNLMLTKKQLRLFDFIKDHIKQERVPPTVREIARHMKCVHSNVHRMLRLLDRDGYIKIYPARPRGIEVLKDG